MLRIFSWAYWPFVYRLWINVYSSPLAIIIIFINLAALGLSCGMQDLLVAACKLLAVACGI